MTTTTLTETYLTANLAALGSRNAELAELLRSPPLSLHSPHAPHAPHPLHSELQFSECADGVLTGTLDGRWLCSRVHPMQEAQQQVREIDLVEHAAVVVLGFGMGYHVRKLAERARKATLIVVFEPDIALLRAVFDQVDHSPWMRDALLIFVTDANDRGTLARKLDGSESILAQGVHVFEHPASKQRLNGSHNGAAQFANLFAEHVAAAKTTLTTTLMRSADTIRNLILNVDHYSCGKGVAELKDSAAGMPAVVVSAGPSLHRNIRELVTLRVRERCVIVAVQTALKPLLEAGVKPHFVTALDYHEISKRFYEDLDAEQLRDVTLIADPKANPVILDVYPGPIRCCGNSFLDKLLASTHTGAREMGSLPAGATVAHLAMYVARYLGCDPIALIGQDLGFPDGLYYAPGNAIHNVWAPELNPFNTLAMMEWQRIARHRTHLKKVRDVHGKSIYTDAQMHTYLQQFERDFAQYKREGLTIVDATEGGVEKQHTVRMSLSEFVARHASGAANKTANAKTNAGPNVVFGPANSPADGAHTKAARDQLGRVRGEVQQILRSSQDTIAILEQMLAQQHDAARMAELFKQIEHHRKAVDKRFGAFELVNQFNQLGVFKRLKADRRLHMQSGLDPVARQRAQLERDLENVKWIADASGDMLALLETGDRVLAGETIELKSRSSAGDISMNVSRRTAIAALVAIQPDDKLGSQRHLAQRMNGQTVLQRTLERLGQSRELESIVVIAPRDCDVESLIDLPRIGLPVHVERVDGSPFGPEHAAIAAARLWADTCWRGGIAGMSAYDEVLCPQTMHAAMRKFELSAALICGANWPLINVIGEGGCDDVVRRHRKHPAQHTLVFTQTPPGLCGCVMSASLMKELAGTGGTALLAGRNRLATVGGILTYQPHAPQHDPIARDANVQIDHRVRNSLVRGTFDSARQWQLLQAAIARGLDVESHDAVSTVSALEAANRSIRLLLPRQLTIELTTDRTSSGVFGRSLGQTTPRAAMPLERFERVLNQLGNAADIVITLAGAGDPLLHPELSRMIAMAKSAGVAWGGGVHVRTELLCDRQTLDELLRSGVDVISVDLNADRAATYAAMMGVDRFKDALMNIEYGIANRQTLTSHTGTAAFALPWIVPRLQRRAETYEDIDTFYDRWQHTLGTAVIEDPPRRGGQLHLPDSLTPAITPAHVVERDRHRCMTILCDGSVPLDWRDFTGSNCVGNVFERALPDVWQALLNRIHAESHAELNTYERS